MSTTYTPVEHHCRIPRRCWRCAARVYAYSTEHVGDQRTGRYFCRTCIAVIHEEEQLG